MVQQIYKVPSTLKVRSDRTRWPLSTVRWFYPTYSSRRPLSSKLRKCIYKNSRRQVCACVCVCARSARASGRRFDTEVIHYRFWCRLLGCKWTISLSFIAYMPFILGQFYPQIYTLIPAGLAVGFGGGPLWCAKCTYLTVVAEALCTLNGGKSKADAVVVRFFGLFFIFYQMAQVWGNLISSSSEYFFFLSVAEWFDIIISPFLSPSCWQFCRMARSKWTTWRRLPSREWPRSAAPDSVRWPMHRRA